ncbi:MAG: ArsR/SmtB family transcription factor [Bacillota bacterium]
MDHAGWSVGPSIVLEMEIALNLLTAPLAEREQELPDEVREILRQIPADWREEGRELLGPPRRWISPLMVLVSLAGVLREADYSKATLAIRSMTLADALERGTAMAARLGVLPDQWLPPAERLADLAARYITATIRATGLEAVRPAETEATIRQETAHAVRLLRDGDLHTRFWHWVDRGYFEFYRPWRESRAEMMREQEERALLALGALRGKVPPPLGWLYPQNPLLTHPPLADAVSAGRMQVHFWVQPFGFFDWLHVEEPGSVLVSFSEPGPLFESFRSQAEAVADRAKAIADPTRLMILRIIRFFSMDNTQIADYLGIARPTVSIHAKVLREAGLIETAQEGRQARHKVKAAEVRRLFQDLIRFLDLPENDG